MILKDAGQEIKEKTAAKKEGAHQRQAVPVFPRRRLENLRHRSFHAWWVSLTPMRNYLERLPARLSPPGPCPFFSNGIDN
jgi:hypothetical protein